MKIGVAGSDGNILCQLNAVREGFEILGHTVVKWDDPEAEFVFVGNPPFAQYLEAAKTKPFIFNVLDLAPHCKEHTEIAETLTKQLPVAAKVTAISESVASQLHFLCSAENPQVIYYPMKPVKSIGFRKYPEFKAAMVGRTSDPNKRCNAAVLSLVRAGFKESEVAIVGPEYPGWGTRVGLVSDEILNDIYNSVDYVMMLSKEEGIGLPAIEGACAGAIPIIAPDLSTFNDFWNESPLANFYKHFTSVDKIAQFIQLLENTPDKKNNIKQAILEYAQANFQSKFDKTEVAKKLLKYMTQSKSNLAILVIGEECIDTFVYGHCPKLSPEAPVPVFVINRLETNSGMAGNVKNNIESLSKDYRVEFIHQSNVISKTRFIDESSGQHLLRVDGDGNISEDNFLQKIIDGMDVNREGLNYKAIVVSDYNKGLLTEELIRVISSKPEKSDFFIFLDTKKVLGEWSKNIDFVKINDKELAHNKSNGVSEPWKFCKNLIVTKGKDGCELYNQDGSIRYKSKSLSENVWSVAGAGDTVLAALVVKFLETQDIQKAMDFSMAAAAIAVSKPGVVSVTKEEIEKFYEQN